MAFGDFVAPVVDIPLVGPKRFPHAAVNSTHSWRRLAEDLKKKRSMSVLAL